MSCGGWRASPLTETPASLLSQDLQALCGQVAARGGALSVPLHALRAIDGGADPSFVRATEQVHSVAVSGVRALAVPRERLRPVLLESASAGLVHRAETGHRSATPGVRAAAIPLDRFGLVLRQA